MESNAFFDRHYSIFVLTQKELQYKYQKTNSSKSETNSDNKNQ